MEIQLSEKQNQLIKSAAQEQDYLRQTAQAEFSKIQKRIDDIVAVVLDSKGVDYVDGIKYEEGKLIVPEAEAVEPAKKPTRRFIPAATPK